MPIATGVRLGPYEVTALIGSGGMGEVYKARDTRLDRTVAIKILPPELSAEPDPSAGSGSSRPKSRDDRRARFEREARAISQLTHPHICALYDIGETIPSRGSPIPDPRSLAPPPVSYLVMEYLEGETLAARLDRGPLPLAEVLRIGIDVTSALDSAHRHGIVHRDLKPANIMLASGGAARHGTPEVKLMDFGLARSTPLTAGATAGTDSPTMPRPITAEGTIVGTLQYMAPEQLEGKDADARTDLWALGCVLHEMATGKQAFAGTSQASLVAAILKEVPRPLTELQPLTPPALERVVKQCLEKDPEERWQSARDVVHELKWIAETGSQARNSAPAHRPRRVRPAWLAAGLLGIAIGVIGTAAVMVRQAGPPVASFTPKSFQKYPIFNARFAPDGQSVVFSAAAEGNTPELYSVRPEYIAPRPLGLRQAHLLAVSLTGEMAVLTAARHIAHNVFSGTLAQLPLGAEAPREVLLNVREADWSPDGSALAIIHDVGGKDRLEYPIGKVLFESGGYLSDLRISPAGDRIAFFDHPVKWDDRGSVKAVDLAGRVTELSSGYGAVEGLAWSRDGNEVYFSGSDASVSASFGATVFAVTPSGKRRVAQEGAGALRILDVSRQGRWLVARDDLRLGITARSPGSTSERDLSWLDGSTNPALSADGQTMLFAEMGGEHNVNYLVCLRRTDGSPVVPLGDGVPQQLSPDGKWALALVPIRPMQLVLYPTGAGEPVKLERGGIEAYEGGAAWFPDGRRIVLCGIEPGKTSRVYVQEMPGGQPQPITPEGTHLGALSPDGKLVLARSSDGSWAAYPVGGGEPRSVPGLTAREEIIRWTMDGHSVYVFDPREVPSRVERFTPATGRRDLVMLLGTEKGTGLTRVTRVSMADDPRVYAYSCYRHLSSLFVVDGAR